MDDDNYPLSFVPRRVWAAGRDAFVPLIFSAIYTPACDCDCDSLAIVPHPPCIVTESIEYHHGKVQRTKTGLPRVVSRRGVLWAQRACLFRDSCVLIVCGVCVNEQVWIMVWRKACVVKHDGRLDVRAKKKARLHVIVPFSVRVSLFCC